jgi:hypothetical protein
LIGQKPGQILLSWFTEDREIAAVDHRGPELACFSHQRAEPGMQFGGAAGEIEGVEVPRLQHHRH